jgi:hypothetical protein
MDPASLRVRLVEVSRAIVNDCSVRGPDAPIVACARHKALAVDAELEALVANESAVLSQIETIRDAAIASGCLPEEVAAQFETCSDGIIAAVATKRVALQTEAVVADSALEGALAAVAALIEVRTPLLHLNPSPPSTPHPKPPTP